jgi:hypothetical protein
MQNGTLMRRLPQLMHRLLRTVHIVCCARDVPPAKVASGLAICWRQPWVYEQGAQRISRTQHCELTGIAGLRRRFEHAQATFLTTGVIAAASMMPLALDLLYDAKVAIFGGELSSIRPQAPQLIWMGGMTYGA